MPPKPSAKGAKKAAKSQKASRTGDKKRRNKRKESYSVYIYRVLKQVHPDTGVSSKAMSIMNSIRCHYTALHEHMKLRLSRMCTSQWGTTESAEMGKKKAIQKSSKGDLIPTPGPLEQQIEGAKIAKSRSEAREKRKRKPEQETEEYIPNNLSGKIIAQARKQLHEIGDEETPEEIDNKKKRMRNVSLGTKSEDDSDLEESPDGDYDDQVVELDPKDEAELAKFMVNKEGGTRTLYDIIQAKIDSKMDDAELALSTVDPNELNVRDLDPEVIEMYKEIGKVLSKYRSGKIPKAFKVIPKMVNWEQILYLTDPDGWSAAAVYQATRLFASNLNPRMCQRFYNLVLLPRLRDDIDEFKKLNFHLYQALCKAMYKPAAFFKGIILPLCESGTCTLREATIFSSVLAKVSIPMFHAAAAMLKISEMEYNGANSVFLRALIDKKFALPYKAIDAVVSHFLRMKNDEREMPVLWHQCLLALCQRYKNDFSPDQKSAIMDLIRYQSHYLISPEIRRELESKAVHGEQEQQIVNKGQKNLVDRIDARQMPADKPLYLFCVANGLLCDSSSHRSKKMVLRQNPNCCSVSQQLTGRMLNSFVFISTFLLLMPKLAPYSSNNSARTSGSPSFLRSLRIASAADLVQASPAALQPYLQIMRLDKPIGTWLLYWPCTWSIALATPAGHLPSLYYLSLFGVGAILMRSAGCVINDLFDKEFDKKVERTKMRPLACGSLTERQAIGLLGGLLSTSLAVLLQMNWFSVAVGSASMILVVVYPLAKRYTYWPQFVLGATLNWGVLIAWAELLPQDRFYTVLPLYISTILHTVIYDTIYSHQYPDPSRGLTFNWGALLGWSAIQGSLGYAPIALYISALQWTLLYDTIYAHQDKADDIMIGVKSTALRFGDKTKTWLCGFGTAAVAGLGLTGYIAEQTWPYYLALFGTAAQLAWQVGTVNINDSKDCWNKFKSNQWMGVILFAGIVAGTYLKKEKTDPPRIQYSDDSDEF
ncbi:hypothetical protein GCK32_005406 [Trichostrongylus colubriformis]|uniref:4-hydroxybenzoate polyprenyltransferase, mitochondrial n=1 Tax=Trichostrongylus colubriformis TaxID=6319 RepID=A0AAN8FTF4_TRICO